MSAGKAWGSPVSVGSIEKVFQQSYTFVRNPKNKNRLMNDSFDWSDAPANFGRRRKWIIIKHSSKDMHIRVPHVIRPRIADPHWSGELRLMQRDGVRIFQLGSFPDACLSDADFLTRKTTNRLRSKNLLFCSPPLSDLLFESIHHVF